MKRHRREHAGKRPDTIGSDERKEKRTPMFICWGEWRRNASSPKGKNNLFSGNKRVAGSWEKKKKTWVARFPTEGVSEEIRFAFATEET